MATLDELREALLPGARSVTPAGSAGSGRSPEVGWVRVMKSRVPAFDALERGDLAIVPSSALAVVAPSPADVTALVEACARSRIGGLLLVESDEGPEARGALEALGKAAGRAGLAAFTTGRVDPAALERSIIGFLVNRRAELDRQAAVLEARLERLAIAGSSRDELMAAVAAFLGRAVALEGRRGEALAVLAPPNVAEVAAAVAGYHARPRAVALRVPLPA
ncbi:MAG: hypothetical protein M3067_11320, partial [Chloroflexota bacterium]|nr:hypothetical protein [Chloroflexota bacterium]